MPKKNKIKNDSDSDEEQPNFKRNPRNRDEADNKITMDEFHRPVKPKTTQPGQKAQRSVTDKKKIRDIERLLQKEGIPQAIKDKKLQDLKELKKVIKSKNEAEKFDLRYKKIKFVEKRKVIRKLNKYQLAFEKADSVEEKEAVAQKKETWQNKLIYINQYPGNWKYISLFAKSGDEEKDKQCQELREKNMAKILQTFRHKIKIREREMCEADQQVDFDNDLQPKDEKVKEIKQPAIDPFFKMADSDMEDDSESDAEKREVARDGQIPKLQKNIEKEQKEQEEKDRKKEKAQLEREWRIKSKKPIKINPSNYRISKAAVDTAGPQKSQHIML